MWVLLPQRPSNWRGALVFVISSLITRFDYIRMGFNSGEGPVLANGIKSLVCSGMRAAKKVEYFREWVWYEKRGPGLTPAMAAQRAWDGADIVALLGR